MNDSTQTPPPPSDTIPARRLRDLLVENVRACMEALAARFFPRLELPAYFIGQRVTFMDRADFAYVLIHLHQLGIETIGGVAIRDAVQRLLRPIDGAATTTFYSYRVAEALLAFGPSFEGNPLLEGLSAVEIDNLRLATDSTDIYDPATRALKGWANNYWAVLARCELRRRQLGIIQGSPALDVALERLDALLFRNPHGFFDDIPELSGRYDIYTADVHLFCEPFWDRLDPARLEANLRAHVRLLEAVALENGAFLAHGRSVGALSVCMTMELGAVSLRLGMAADPDRTRRLIDRARRAFFDEWIADDLIAAHRHRATEAYRGVQRMLQMTLDCLGKVCFVAQELEAVPAVEPGPGAPVAGARSTFPEIDEWIAFDDGRSAGLWMFRNAQIAFQLACVDGGNADYAPCPRAPGRFENPVDSRLICGVPRVARGSLDYSCLGLPASVEKLPGGLRLAYDGFAQTSASPATGQPLPGRREVEYRVDGDTLTVTERWSFETLPDAITFHLPEAATPLKLEILSLPEGAHASVAAVGGLAEWRSAWSEPRRVHQVDFPRATETSFSYRVRPVLRVAVAPRNNDYTGALYDAMPPGEIIERKIDQHARLGDADALARAYAGDADILHVGWPEHLFAVDGLTPDEFLRRSLDFVAALGRLPVRIVWTQHNRVPHAASWREEGRGRTIYRAWAAVADGVIHHSRWGMELMRAELPFKPTARHAVVPHGHFGTLMPTGASRAELEARFGLAPCAVRFGVVGRPQNEKQAEMIVRAFRAGGCADQQLFVTAVTPAQAEELRGDPRITLLPRDGWFPREFVADQLRVCDALVCAQTGDTYLTSGANADAVGLGLAMLVPEWGYFRETLGEAAFYHDNTEGGLARLFASLGPGEIARGQAAAAALRPACAWPRVAEETLRFFRGLPSHL